MSPLSSLLVAAALAAALSAPSVLADECEVFLAPAGEDTSQCNDAATPCLTLSRGIQAVKTAFAVAENCTNGVTLSFARGKYTGELNRGASVVVPRGRSLHINGAAGEPQAVQLDGGGAARLLDISTDGVGTNDTDGATASVWFVDLTFEHGKVADDGGALRVGAGVHLLMSNVRFLFNEAGERGGALSVHDNSLLTNVFFQQNTAHGVGKTMGGGGMYVAASRQIYLRSCHFMKNEAGKGAGGGLYIDGFPDEGPKIDVEFDGNHAANGGGLYVSERAGNVGGTTRYENCSFHANTADEDGGALYVENSFGGQFDQLHCWQNHAHRDGGCVYSKHSASEFSNVNVTVNKADAGIGGGFYFVGDTRDAGGGGGAAAAAGGDAQRETTLNGTVESNFSDKQPTSRNVYCNGTYVSWHEHYLGTFCTDKCKTSRNIVPCFKPIIKPPIMHHPPSTGWQWALGIMSTLLIVAFCGGLFYMYRRGKLPSALTGERKPLYEAVR